MAKNDTDFSECQMFSDTSIKYIILAIKYFNYKSQMIDSYYNH